MRLHRLSMTAFGPFAGTVDIDFDDVASSGLFLIRGATGAGKTSILDAVCFALYAAVPGARPSGRSLRSDHAAPDVVPSVTLEFTASGRRFRVERSPEFLRPKKRGQGMTKAPARVVLHEQVSGSWVGKDNRHDDVAAVLTEVLGMGLEQFSKVVLLPQGEFAAFLRASPEARREVLERLFDISSFAGIEDWLIGERRRSAELLAERRSAVATGLARLADALADAPAGLLDDAADWEAMEPHQVPTELERLHGALDGFAVQTLTDLDAAATAAESAASRSQAAERIIDLQQKARTATSRLAELETAGALHSEARATLAQAARAAAVSGELRTLARAEAAQETARTRAQRTGTALARFGLDDRGADGAAAWTDRLRSHDEMLAAAARLAKVIDERARRSTGLRDRATAAHATVEALGDERKRAELAFRSASELLASAAAAATGLDGLQARVETAERLLAVRCAHDRGVVARRDLSERLAAARTREQDHRQRLLDLREARLANMAGELAEGLADGEPCAVCGSCAHPNRAVRTHPVTADDIDDADDRWSSARTALETLERELVAADTEADSRRALLDGDERPEAELRDALESAQTARAQAGALASKKEAAEQSLTRAEADRAALDERGERLQAEVLTITATLTELERALVDDQRALAAILRDHAQLCPCAGGAEGAEGAEGAAATHTAGAAHPRPESLESVLAVHRQTVTHAEQHLDALRTVATTTTSVVESTAALTAALAEHGFADAEDARAAALPEPEVRRLEELCAAYERSRAEAETVLADPEVRVAADAPPPDVAALKEAAAAAQVALLHAKDAETLARRTLGAVARLRHDLVRQCEALGPDAARHALLRELADTFAGTSGTNTLRMRLTSYVLAARLEKVATLANERLAVMGDGRYRLQHSDGLAARGARSGLGLSVQDLWTGHSRDTSTLSGGEAFMASLALALGLADAVREEAGGFDLQTLFVDEGFGTLDEESLEQVMAVLDGLREGGRAVGVVSHVAELRSRIPSQICVDKTESGSSVRVFSAAAAEPAA